MHVTIRQRLGGAGLGVGTEKDHPPSPWGIRPGASAFLSEPGARAGSRQSYHRGPPRPRNTPLPRGRYPAVPGPRLAGLEAWRAVAGRGGPRRQSGGSRLEPARAPRRGWTGRGGFPGSPRLVRAPGNKRPSTQHRIWTLDRSTPSRSRLNPLNYFSHLPLFKYLFSYKVRKRFFLVKWSVSLTLRYLFLEDLAFFPRIGSGTSSRSVCCSTRSH